MTLKFKGEEGEGQCNDSLELVKVTETWIVEDQSRERREN